MVLNICERWVQDKDKRLVTIYTVFLVYIMIVLITFRVHYIIGRTANNVDLPIGISTAFLIYWYCRDYARLLDNLYYRFVYRPTVGQIVSYVQRRKRPEHTPPAAAASLDISGHRKMSLGNSRKGSSSSTQTNTPLLVDA